MKKQILLALMAVTSLGSLQAAEKGNNNLTPTMLTILPIVSATLECTTMRNTIRPSEHSISFKAQSENDDLDEYLSLRFPNPFVANNATSLRALQWNFIYLNLLKTQIESERRLAQTTKRYERLKEYRERKARKDSSITTRNCDFTRMLQFFHL